MHAGMWKQRWAPPLVNEAAMPRQLPTVGRWAACDGWLWVLVGLGEIGRHFLSICRFVPIDFSLAAFLPLRVIWFPIDFICTSFLSNGPLMFRLNIYCTPIHTEAQHFNYLETFYIYFFFFLKTLGINLVLTLTTRRRRRDDTRTESWETKRSPLGEMTSV